jgi:hypothetical protein
MVFSHNFTFVNENQSQTVVKAVECNYCNKGGGREKHQFKIYLNSKFKHEKRFVPKEQVGLGAGYGRKIKIPNVGESLSKLT